MTPSGKRVYLVQYRLKGRSGRTRRVTIGRHGTLTVSEARAAAKGLLVDVAAGNDPAEIRAEARRDLTVAELCEKYIAECCAHKKPSTIAIDRGRIERHIVPLLGRKRVREIAKGDVQRFMRDVAAGKSAADV